LSAAPAKNRVLGNLNNRAFVALLGALLVFFLAASALVLLGNVWYLARGAAEGRGSGWALFLASLRDPENHFAIKLSLITGAVTTLISMIFAIPSAYILSRYRLPGSKLIDTILDLPIVVPPPVMGMSLLILFQTAFGQWITQTTGQWVYTQRGIVMAQFFVACAFGVRAIKASFDTIGRRHEDVARTLGCTHSQAFFRVVLPMARTGILAGAVMTWARSIAEFGPVLFFCGATRWKTEVMPIAMFLNYSGGKIEASVALVIIMISISIVTLLTFKKLGGRGYLW
jgi:molybdate transport system permease protein